MHNILFCHCGESGTQTGLIKAKLQVIAELLPKFATKEKTNLGLKMIVYGSTEVPLTNRSVPQILICIYCLTETKEGLL